MGESPAMPISAKLIATVSLLLWVGAILAGNQLPPFQDWAKPEQMTDHAITHHENSRSS